MRWLVDMLFNREGVVTPENSREIGFGDVISYEDGMVYVVTDVGSGEYYDAAGIADYGTVIERMGMPGGVKREKTFKKIGHISLDRMVQATQRHWQGHDDTVVREFEAEWRGRIGTKRKL
jgi:hypothetical protein